MQISHNLFNNIPSIQALVAQVLPKALTVKIIYGQVQT